MSFAPLVDLQRFEAAVTLRNGPTRKKTPNHFVSIGTVSALVFRKLFW